MGSGCVLNFEEFYDKEIQRGCNKKVINLYYVA